MVALREETAGVVLHGAEVWMGLVVTACVGALLGAVLGGIGRRASLGGAASVLVVLLLCMAPQVGTVLVHAPRGWGLGSVALGIATALAGRRWRNARLLPALLALELGLVVSQGIWRTDPTPPGPPLLVVTLDTTRADSLAPWAAEAAGRAPVLEAFAAEATTYLSAHAPVALTGPAHAALFSGSDAVLAAVPRNGLGVPPDVDWLWTTLRRSGWDTSGVVSAAVLDERLGFCRGLRRCDTAFSDRLLRGHPLLRGLGWRSRAGIAVQRADEQTAAVAAHLWQSSRGTPALWVHLYGPHWPYTPSPSARSAEGVSLDAGLPDRALPGLGTGSWTAEQQVQGAALYRSQLRDLDGVLGSLLAAVGPDAAVVVVGDHGEGLGEHNDAFQHGRLPFSPASRVPLAIRCPGEAARAVAEPVSTASLWSLLAPCLRLSVPPVAPVRTRTWAADGPSGPLGALSGLAVRSAGWTVAGSRWHPVAAYETVHDPLEVSPLPVERAPAALQAAWSEAASIGTAQPSEPVLPAEALKALGYLDGVSGSAR